jgi:putative DNA methylase
MIPLECKRLAEVDFPIAAVSRHAAKEKSIRHGHPSTLHLWWARRPLASCRAMLLALLLPDPCDPHCPVEFKTKARELLKPVPGRLGVSDLELREALLHFIGDFADWDHACNSTFLEAGRGLVKAAHPEETPLVVDPFAGGGAIPLEALRLGCEAIASDLNPVACLILKTMLDDIPRYGPGLVDELRRVGEEIKAAAGKELAQYYPPDPDSARPIAYLWARTVRCEAPNCGAEIPLVRSFWLSKKAGRHRVLRYRVERPHGAPPHLAFEIFEPKKESDVPRGTVSRAKATCPCCSTVLAPDRVRAQLRVQRGGADVIFDGKGRRSGGAILLTVVTLRAGTAGRLFRLPQERDYAAVKKSIIELDSLRASLNLNALSIFPNEPTPKGGGAGASRAFSVYNYGMTEWSDLFTARQKIALLAYQRIITAGITDPAIRDFIGLAYSRWTDIFNALCQWESSKTQVRHLFTRQALPMLWDFAENCVASDQAGDFNVTLSTMLNVVDAIPPSVSAGQIFESDARRSPLPDYTAGVWFTDPPYYDAVPYADLSDFFFVWLKRALPGHPLLSDASDLSNPLTPKAREVVQDETKIVDGKPKDRAFFENAMSQAFAEGRRVTRDDGIASVVFAHKTTEGWEALLSGMIKGGWVVTGSWPIATESATRLRAHDSAALATSVHLVCRPRTEDAIGDWANVLRELPSRVAEWMVRLEREGVRGADLVFACIGPALEIFSRYSRVETPDGGEVPLSGTFFTNWAPVRLKPLLRMPRRVSAISLSPRISVSNSSRMMLGWSRSITRNREAEEMPDTMNARRQRRFITSPRRVFPDRFCADLAMSFGDTSTASWVCE